MFPSLSAKTSQTLPLLNMTNLEITTLSTKVSLKKIWTSLSKSLRVSSRLLEKNRKDNPL